MANKNIVTIFFTVAIALMGAIPLSTDTNTSTVFASHDFAANLTSQQEVPSVDT